MADKQVAIAGEIFDVNASADHDMRYQIPAAEFEKMLEEAGMTRDGAKTARSGRLRSARSSVNRGWEQDISTAWSPSCGVK